MSFVIKCSTDATEVTHHHYSHEFLLAGEDVSLFVSAGINGFCNQANTLN